MRNMFLAIENWMDDDSIILSLIKLMLIFGIPIFVVIALLSYADSKDPHIVLNKNEWSCSRSHTILVPVLVGKIIVQQPSEVCDVYERSQ